MTAPANPVRPMRVVLHADGSSNWHVAARLLGEYARTTGAHVTVVCALLLPGNRKRALDAARAMLDLPDAQVETVGRPGLIERLLPEVARTSRADVVVMGRLGAADALTSGLLAHLVAKRTPASVLVARGRPTKLRTMLLATEGARHGVTDFERAADLAQAFGARLDILHVVSEMGLTDRARAEIEENLRDFLHSDAPVAEHLRDLESRLRSRGLEGTVLVRSGLVVDEIVDAVREGGHDLLVIGAHDIAGPGANLYEDFASLILRASPVSTLVVRDRARRPEP